MFLIFAIVWQIFGSSEVQSWDNYWEDNKYQNLRNIQGNSESDEETIQNSDDVQ